MLQIAPEKVAHVIVRAREFDVKVAPWDDHDSAERENESDSILEDTSGDTVADEIKAFIDGLNEDEQVSLVALMWIGRGTYESEELSEAIETARSERVNKTSDYLLGVPLLADYLEEGLQKFNYSAEDIENDVL
ncbi:MAG: DUF3775 domain-containing protein [Hyphomicrobiaceae bacterium]